MEKACCNLQQGKITWHKGAATCSEQMPNGTSMLTNAAVFQCYGAYRINALIIFHSSIRMFAWRGEISFALIFLFNWVNIDSPNQLFPTNKQMDLNPFYLFLDMRCTNMSRSYLGKFSSFQIFFPLLLIELVVVIFLWKELYFHQYRKLYLFFFSRLMG